MKLLFMAKRADIYRGHGTEVDRTVTLALDAGAINRLISNINLYLLLFHFFQNDVSLRYVTKWRENSHIVTEHLLFVAPHCWQLQTRRVHYLAASVQLKTYSNITLYHESNPDILQRFNSVVPRNNYISDLRQIVIQSSLPRDSFDE